jgi:hypothetical protein
MSSSKVSTTANQVVKLQQRAKDLFSEDVINTSPFAKELYKQVRNKLKKLDDIVKIEEKQKEKGAVKITEEQAEKLKNKDNFLSSVLQALEYFEIYKKQEFAVAQQARQQQQQQEIQETANEGAVEETKSQQVAAEAPEDKKEMKQFSTQTNPQGGVENKVVECSIL